MGQTDHPTCRGSFSIDFMRIVRIHSKKIFAPSLFFCKKVPAPSFFFAQKSVCPVIFYFRKSVCPVIFFLPKTFSPPPHCPWCRPINFAPSLKNKITSANFFRPKKIWLIVPGFNNFSPSLLPPFIEKYLAFANRLYVS